MESLYTKYRPQAFDEVVGQHQIVATLKVAVCEQRTTHAYLFCGPRGTGKTTMARLLAKALLCDAGPNALPDGSCEQCQLIANGVHPDVYELDAASRTGVDAVREEIISRTSFAPVRGTHKVYIIDEVHMLSRGAFNALLKTLEEPPAHVVFVLCTTDPNKIPDTIQSRVQRFDFRPIGLQDIKQHLEYVCTSEGFSFEGEALDLVCRRSQGGMRDALTTLEQLSVFGNGTISLDAAKDLLGEFSEDVLRKVVHALAVRDIGTLFQMVATMANSSGDLLQFVLGLAERMRDVYVVALLGAQEGIVDADELTRNELSQEAQAFGSADRLARMLTVLSDVVVRMKGAANQRLELEVAFTRLARPDSDITLESLAERIAVLEQRLAQGVVATASAPAPTAGSMPVSTPATEPVPAPAPVAEPVPVPGPVVEAAPAIEPTPALEQAQQTQDTAPQTKPSPKRVWRDFKDAICKEHPSFGSLLLNAEFASDDGTVLTAVLPAGSSFALRMLERDDVRAGINEVLERYFGTRRLVFQESRKSGVQSAATPATSTPTSTAPFEPVEIAPTQVPEPAPTSAPMPESEPAPATPAPEQIQTSEPTPVIESVPTSEPMSAPEPVPTPEPASAPEPTPTPEPPQAPEHISMPESTQADPLIPESLTAMLEDVFGPGVTISTIPQEENDTSTLHNS